VEDFKSELGVVKAQRPANGRNLLIDGRKGGGDKGWSARFQKWNGGANCGVQVPNNRVLGARHKLKAPHKTEEWPPLLSDYMRAEVGILPFHPITPALSYVSSETMECEEELSWLH
jgi:hypothetical protein